MPHLQATWTNDQHLFWWSPNDHVEAALEDELPALAACGEITHRYLISPNDPKKRTRTRGLQMSVVDFVPTLATLEHTSSHSDSVRCFTFATKLALELASRQRVVPSVYQNEAKWRALLSHESDKDRFQALAQALPIAARCVPVSETTRGAAKLIQPHHTLRSFINSIVDTVYRQNKYPGTARGWVRELADALRGEEAAFSPRDARFQGTPDMLEEWSIAAESSGLKVGMMLQLPSDQAGQRFPLKLWVHPPGQFDNRVPLSTAWQAGDQLTVNGKVWSHPAHCVLRSLAHASRIFPPLLKSLTGPKPRSPIWNADTTWAFLEQGAQDLKDAGLEVHLPEEFELAGRLRIRVQIRIDRNEPDDTPIDLSEPVPYRWEVTLGDIVLSGSEFAELLSKQRPIVRFRDEWVLLDPRELARLPEGLPMEGTLDASTALRAILTGQHDGVDVVASDALRALIDDLKNPPEVDIPDTLQGTLRPYQLQGVSWMHALGRAGLGACLADDMGLGKTIQLITHLLCRHARGPRGPTLVVCPTSVMGNWQHELRRFAPTLNVHRHHGVDRFRVDFERVDVVITTYGLLVRDQDLLTDTHWDVLALDEAQGIKNPDSQRARAARRLQANQRIALSGTPVENRLDELWSLMHFLIPGLLGPRQTFRREVALPIERFGDEGLAARLKHCVRPFLLRRVKTDPNVISDLPNKIEREEYVPLTQEQATLYASIIERSFDTIRDADDFERRGHVLAMLTALKQVCNHPSQYLGQTDEPLIDRSGKLERCMEILDNIIESNTRCLIFTQYREMGNRLQQHILDMFDLEAPFLHGGTSSAKRDELVQRFQEDDHASPILIISLRAGGTGLNLTRATHVVHYDRWWNPAVEDQATDRAYRIGQNQTVQVHKMVSQGTLEERISSLLEQKRALAESVVGSGERWLTELNDDALHDLVRLGDDVVVEEGGEA